MAGYGGSPFPVGSSPYGYAPAPLPQPFNAPGTLTFTTETDKRGRPEYHIFRYVPSINSDFVSFHLTCGINNSVLSPGRMCLVPHEG